MILIETEKNDDTFAEILALSDAAFDGIERPPRSILRAHFYTDDVFVLRHTLTNLAGKIYAFAIVTERNGPYIWSIAVAPANQKCGQGKKLLEEIETYYRERGRQTIGLTCKVTNPAQKLYFDCGYRVEMVAKKYYGPEGDGLFMRRTL